MKTRNTTRSLLAQSLLLLSLGCALACAGHSQSAAMRGAASPDEALERRPEGSEIPVEDFRRVTAALAEDLVRTPILAAAASPPVVTIRRLENKTDAAIDGEIFQETIRVGLLGRAQGRVLFRDDASYDDILKERLRASSEDVNVTLTDTVVAARVERRGRDLRFETGSLSGLPASSTREALRAEQSGRVASGVARADYFLRGIVYEMEETSGRSGSYFQYQFRLVDSRSGIIVWEKMLDSRPGDPYPTDAPVGGSLSLSQADAVSPPQVDVKPARASAPVASLAAPAAYVPAAASHESYLPAVAASYAPVAAASYAPAAAASYGGDAAPELPSVSAAPASATRVASPSRAALAELPPLAFGRYHALVIGNERYDSLPSLRASANDARAVARLLRESYGFEVELLLDASRSEIVSALADYRGRLGAEDNLLVYYAGHGWFDEEARQGYWLPVEAREDDPADWLSNATINDMLRANEARHILVVADSCYSGTLTRGVVMRGRSDRAQMFQKLLGKRSRTALTSGGLEPVEDDGGAGHSVFAEAFMAGLRDNPGVLDGHGLFNAVRRKVMVQADQTPEYGDIRRVGHEGGDFLFVRPGSGS